MWFLSKHNKWGRMKNLSPQIILPIIPIVICCALCVPMIKFLSAELKRYQVEQLIGTSLPASVSDLRYHKYQPFYWDPMTFMDPYHITYIRFRASEQEYIELMERMDMEFYDKDQVRFWASWPGKWGAGVPNIVDEWWNPKLNTPRYAARNKPDDLERGRIFAIYEDGYVFIKFN